MFFEFTPSAFSSSLSTMRLISFSFIFVMLGLSSLADTLLKQDGVSLKGKVELLESGKINVGSVTILPEDVQLLEFDQPPSIESTNELDRLTLGLMAVEIPGALSVGGTYIARPVIALDETKLTFEGDPEGIFLSTVNTAAVFFAPLSLGQSEELRSRKPGLMLRSGDFVEGKPLRVHEGNIEIESILFGRMTYRIGIEVVALWMKKPKIDSKQYSIGTRSGDLILSDKINVELGALVVNQVPLRNYRINQSEISSIQKGKVADVLTLAWQKLDRATPEKRAQLMASVENLGRSVQLRRELQLIELKLTEARTSLTKAAQTRDASVVDRTLFLGEWQQKQNVWRDKNRNYWKTRSNNIRMASQVRVRRSALDRAKQTLNKSQHTLDKYNQKLEEFEKDISEGNIKVKDKKDEQRRRESYLRPIKRAQKSMQKAQQQLESAQRDDKKIQAESKPLPLEENKAKETLDQAKEDIDKAKKKYDESLAQYRLAIRAHSDQSRKVRELEGKRDQMQQELNKLDIPSAPPSR